jgi:hypothetical protein
VTSGDRIVPVGFLGWPWFLSIWIRAFDGLDISLIGAALVLSSTLPFYFLLRERMSEAASWLGTIVAFTFPSVILYANRSLFANLPMIAFALWTLFFLRILVRRTFPKTDWQPYFLSFLVGCFGALALATRPFEAIWFVPWLAWAGWKWRPQRWQMLACVLGVLTVAIPVVSVANDTYGSLFAIGYWLRDNLTETPLTPPLLARGGGGSGSIFPLIRGTEGVSVSVMPFGFHPRNIIWNARAFLFGLLWPWMILLLVGFGWFLKKRFTQHATRNTQHLTFDDVPWLLGIWTVGVVIVANGNGLYADHVRLGAVTIGNSFLRYALPLAPIIGWAAAWMMDAMPRRSWKIAGAVVCVSLAGFGGWRALAADDEGLLATRVELQRYEEIRVAFRRWFQPGDVMLSERSDKIAFPSYRAVSPLPPMEDVGTLVRDQKIGVGLFVRPLSQAQKDAWRKAGLEAQELGTFGRENLYRLVTR